MWEEGYGRREVGGRSMKGRSRRTGRRRVRRGGEIGKERFRKERKGRRKKVNGRRERVEIERIIWLETQNS